MTDAITLFMKVDVGLSRFSLRPIGGITLEPPGRFSDNCSDWISGGLSFVG